MAYKLTGPAGMQAVDVTSTTAEHIVGTRAHGTDPLYGTGEFIYLLGVANTAVGSIVTYDVTTFQTTLCAVGGNIARPVAIAMSANVASQYGWYQVAGIAVAKKSCTISLAAGAAVGVLTTGLVAGTGSGKEIQGACVAAVASATAGRTTVSIYIDRPHKQGRVT